MQKNLEKMLVEQVIANQKSYNDKKLQTGDDNIESFENHSVNDHIMK